MKLQRHSHDDTTVVQKVASGEWVFWGHMRVQSRKARFMEMLCIDVLSEDGKGADFLRSVVQSFHQAMKSASSHLFFSFADKILVIKFFSRFKNKFLFCYAISMPPCYMDRKKKVESHFHNAPKSQTPTKENLS